MKNGFTLIELIVTITIVIALALFITPKVVKFSNDSKATGYKKKKKRLEEAAAKYILEQYIPSSTTSMTITSQMLYDANYIDKIKDIDNSDKFCTATVNVTNMDTTPVFVAHLTCDNYTS